MLEMYLVFLEEIFQFNEMSKIEFLLMMNTCNMFTIMLVSMPLITQSYLNLIYYFMMEKSKFHFHIFYTFKFSFQLSMSHFFFWNRSLPSKYLIKNLQKKITIHTYRSNFCKLQVFLVETVSKMCTAEQFRQIFLLN